MENRLFNLEKIKDLTSPVDILQANLFQLTEISRKVENYTQSLIQLSTDKDFKLQINILTDLINSVNLKLENILSNNIKCFLSFQEALIKKYKESYLKKLKKIKLNTENLSKIGLSLIENKSISRTLNGISYIPSIEVNQWIEILDSLKQNTIFLRFTKRIQSHYDIIVNDRLQMEFSKIPRDTDLTLIKNYEKAFRKDPIISFKEFQQIIDNKLTKQELKRKKQIVAREREREEFEKLKKKQNEQKDTYEDYLKLSNREFERRIRKQSRGKLSIISKKDVEEKKIEISEEISEKIEKFKSKFNKSFEEKYLIKKDEEKDPIDLIRERKSKKDKEYKHFKDHFKEN